MKNTYLYNKCRATIALTLFLILVSACEKLKYTSTTTEDVNLTGYLDKNADKFSLFSQIIERSGSSGYLSAYGKYTLFTPTNDAVTQWLQSISKASVNDLTVAELKNVVNYHLIMDTLSTKTFTDGKIAQLTLFGHYLTTGVTTTTEGKSLYTINRDAKIIQSNIRTGNGIIQVIDKVLIPRTKTIAQEIADNPRYSIFKQALVETGFYDSLNIDPSVVSANPTRKFLTVIAESDSALNKAGFATYADLKARMSTAGNPALPADSLYLYVAYHITPHANYVADIISASSLNTLAPSEVIGTKFAGRTVFLNEVEFNGQIEPGAEINRSKSDISASNGVIHDSKSFFKIKVRVPTPLYWDVDIDGIRNHPNYGKVQIDLGSGALLTSIDPSSYKAERYVIGQVSMYTFGQLGSRVANKTDWYRLAMSFNGGARPMWQEFRTPLLVKGLYKVWICYPNVVSSGTSQWIINPGTSVEQALPLIMNNGDGLNNSGQSMTAPNSDALLEGAGFKRYIALNTETAVDKTGATITGDVSNTHTGNIGRLVGVANIRTTDRHWIRARQITGANGGNETQIRHAICLDMIHFIPIAMDQQYPRFSKSGTVFKRP